MTKTKKLVGTVYKKMLKKQNMTHHDVAEAFGISPSAVLNAIRYAEDPEFRAWEQERSLAYYHERRMRNRGRRVYTLRR